MSKAELTDAVAAGLAGLAILLQIALVALVVVALAARRSPAAARGLDALRWTLAGSELWIAFAAALVAMLGSLYFSEVADFVPCTLCWYQRIAMYPLVVVLLVAALRRDRGSAFAYGLPLCVIGAAISAYHIYIEINPDAEAGFCTAGGPPCSTKWIEEFGYVTIPVLAITAFATIAAMLALARPRRGNA